MIAVLSGSYTTSSPVKNGTFVGKLIIEYANSPVSACKALVSVFPAPIKVTAVPTTIDGVEGVVSCLNVYDGRELDATYINSSP